MLALGRICQGLGENVFGNPEIQKSGPGYFDLVADVGEVEFGNDLSGQLPRIHLAGLGQSHQSVGLIIAELWIRTRLDEDGSDLRVWQDKLNGCLESLLDELMRKQSRFKC